MEKDFAEIEPTISLHGLGFMQVKLPGKGRLHVWHPDLPRRECADMSQIHNHRFSFRSTILKGTQHNRRWDMEIHPEGEYDIISHNGPRSERGGRLSFVAGRCNMFPRETEIYGVGESYEMPIGEYHDTPNTGIVITVMQKLSEGRIHANSILQHGNEFDQMFDRFQFGQDKLWQFVREAFEA